MECGDAPPQSQSQPTATAAAATATTSAEEQALKRNTDCVYFLASPLTCKKGSECEYRHSDVARVNPRDCWFWLNGNCLNPKCGFRHPPLDGLLGSQVSNPVGSSVHPAHVEAASEVHTYTSNKQGVPCIFFQKGFCLKGDRCSFLHAPNPVSKKVPQGPAATTTSEPQSLKRAFGGLDKFTQVQNVAKTNAPNSHGSRPQEKLAIKVETALTKNSITVNKNAVPPSGSADEFMRYRPENVTTVINGNLGSRSNRHQANLSDDHGSLVGKDADDLSREPSPGFDVLVDDEHRDSDYYNDEDQYRRSRGHDGTYLSSMNEYDIGHSAEYGAMTDADQDIYHDSLGYDLYDHMHGQYGRERRRSSSAQPEIRQFPEGKSYDKIDELDLRHHLSKRKRANALRSVINHDNASENHVEDQNHHVPRRDTRYSTAHESWLSSRLKGRITIPGRSSSPVNGSDLRSGREFDWGRNQNRLSPGRLRIPHLGRLRDRIKGRIEDVVSNEGRNPRGAHLSRESVHENGADFARPRSLAELKDWKNTRSNEQHKEDQQFFTLGKIKYPRFEDHQQSEGDLSFEGPKPLSEILKRKKVADISASESGMTSNNNGNNGQKKVRRGLIKCTAILEKQATHFSESKDKGFRSMHGTNKQSKFENSRNGGAEDGLVVSEKSTEDQSSLGRHRANELQSEDPDSVMVDEATEDHETEAYDHRDGYYGYEKIEGEAFEGENDEDEYLDDDDDFAKKMGVVYS